MSETEHAAGVPAPAEERPGGHALEKIIEALLLASELPLSLEQLHRLIGDELGVDREQVREGLAALASSLATRAAELTEVASGYRIQVRRDYAEWVARLWQE